MNKNNQNNQLKKSIFIKIYNYNINRKKMI